MISLAVKYRPTEFKDILGQKSIMKILTRQLETGDLKNCYLFCGPSGDGKTTTARAFANMINEGVGEPIEIDAASNNGVENVRQIIKSASERSLDGKYKIYIIDECHSISTQGWQAFLKCIEEPPTYTIFIFCTTDPQKIPPTIMNRVMRFNFTRVGAHDIYERLMYISQQEGYQNYPATCAYISRICNGGVRDAIALLEKCASYDTDIKIDNCLAALGNYSFETYFNLTDRIVDGNVPEVLSIINQLYEQGNDLKVFVNTFCEFMLDLTKYVTMKTCEATHIPDNMEDKLKFTTGFENAAGYFYYYLDKLIELKSIIKDDPNMKDTIEIIFIQMCRLK